MIRAFLSIAFALSIAGPTGAKTLNMMKSIDAPHYDLGRVGSEPHAVFDKYRAFRRWVDDVLDPAARTRGITSCEMCHKHLAELPVPEKV